MWKIVPTRVSTGSLVIALVMIKAALFLVLLPPWQGPDEPTRLEPAFIIARSDALLPALNPDLGYQSQTLASMRRFKSWGFYERRPPQPTVKTFSDANLPAGASILYEPALTYLPAGLAVRWWGGQSVESSLYAARFSSLIWHVLATALVALIANLVFKGPNSPLPCVAVVLMFGLHPQLSFLASSVHADSFGQVLSAVVLVLLILVTKRIRTPGFSISWFIPFVAAIILVGFSGYVIRKMLILAPFLVSCAPLLFWPQLRRAGAVEALSRMILISLGVGFLFCAALYQRPELVGWRLLGFPQLGGLEELGRITLGDWVRYLGILYATFWLALGSLVNKLSLGWIGMLGLSMGAAVAFWFQFLGRCIAGRRRSENVDLRVLAMLGLWLAWVSLSIVVAYGPQMGNAEGRYLLSALPAIACLWVGGLMLGSSRSIGLEMVRLWAGLVLLLNAVALFKYLIPIYYLGN